MTASSTPASDPEDSLAFEIGASPPARCTAIPAALPLLNKLAASPPETRLTLLDDARTSATRVNAPVFDVDGSFLGTVDLLEPISALGLEYDGAYHREISQQTADNHREEGLERRGLTIIRVTSVDMVDEPALISRIQRAHHACLSATPIHPQRWTFAPRAA